MAYFIYPFLNTFFDKIYKEKKLDYTPIIERALKLHAKNNVPPETALMLTAIETGISEDQILHVLGATNANDLYNIVDKNPRNLFIVFSRILKNGFKKP